MRSSEAKPQTSQSSVISHQSSVISYQLSVISYQLSVAPSFEIHGIWRGGASDLTERSFRCLARLCWQVGWAANSNMNTISMDTVAEIWDRLCDANEEEAQALARRFQEEQPFIMIYLLAMDEEVMDEDERGDLMELGAYILEIMSTVQPNLRQVTAEELEVAEKANVQEMETLEEGSEMDFTDAVQGMISGYNQMPLLGAALEALMSDHEDAPELAPANIGMSLLYLKTVIDCLDRSDSAA